MNLINSSIEIMDSIETLKQYPKNIERIGRICYKSEDRITEDSYQKFIKMIIDYGHESVLEHEKITIKIVCDRGVSHELVRHRIASFSQESQRYCNYKNNITFIIPHWLKDRVLPGEYELFDIQNKFTQYNDPARIWLENLIYSEKNYKQLSDLNLKPQDARGILPNATKTELYMTANLREWRHILKLRISSAAHPDMREIMSMILDQFYIVLPEIFGGYI